MIRYLWQRLWQLALLLVGISFITYGLMYISPSDPAEIQLLANDSTPTEEALKALREEMGLDDPFIVQYTRWMKNIAVGDFGYSHHFRQNVVDVLLSRVPLTLYLSIVAFLLFIISSIVLGIFSVIYQNRLADYIIRLFSVMTISIPGFWLGLILLYIFGVKLHLLPITYTNTWHSIILPAVTLSFPLIGKYTRLFRAEIAEQYQQDYVVGAQMTGTSEITIMLRYILPNAIINILPLIGLSIATLLGGTVIVEMIFSWNGLGKMAMDAITYRDYDLLQAYVLGMTTIYVFCNLLVDYAVYLMDPRIARDEALAE